MMASILTELGVCALFVSSVALLNACNQNGIELRVYERQAVLGGTISGPEDDAVVKIDSLAASGTLWTCSGTLVAPNLVLTARHCITNFADGFWTCDPDGTLRSSGPGQMGTLDTPGNITVRAGTGPNPARVAKGTNIFAPQADSICVNDIALVQLDSSLTNLPIMPIRLFTGTSPGEQIRVVGYGVDDDGGIGVRHTRSGLTVSQVGSSQFRPVGDPIPPRTFTTIGPSLCIGDSGGPALSDNNAVIGIFSQYDGACTAANATDIFTEVAPYATDVILPAFAAIGYDPWLEGNSEPGLYGTGGDGSTGGASSTGGDTSAQSASGGSTSSDTSAGGAPVGTGGDTSGPAVYDQGPPAGGSCACRAAGARRSGLGIAAVAAVGLLGLRRRGVPSRPRVK